ncbi:hypothetical protein NC651_015321 [Populus alba x Populus x berolinensis]|nr:hypothetical protein NC651_015321 [Populus alba x Populus x berolinensis]
MWKKIAVPNNVDAVVFKTSSYLVTENFNFPSKNRCTSGCACAVYVEFKLPFQDNLLVIPMKVKEQLEKGAQVSDSTLVEGAKKSTQYVSEKGAQAKDSIVEGAKKTSEHIVAEKVETAKDATMKSGKGAVHYVDISSNAMTKL